VFSGSITEEVQTTTEKIQPEAPVPGISGVARANVGRHLAARQARDSVRPDSSGRSSPGLTSGELWDRGSSPEPAELRADRCTRASWFIDEKKPRLAPGKWPTKRKLLRARVGVGEHRAVAIPRRRRAGLWFAVKTFWGGERHWPC